MCVNYMEVRLLATFACDVGIVMKGLGLLQYCTRTVEPDTFGISRFVLCGEVVLFQR